MSSEAVYDLFMLFIPFFLSEVTKIMLCAAQASHHLVPPEVRTDREDFVIIINTIFHYHIYLFGKK